MKITPHFSLAEFDRPARPGRGFPDPAPYPEEWINARLRPLCDALEILRAELGAPIRVISGYRDPAYNVQIGGARRSQHMEGRAADIVVAGFKAADVHRRVLELYGLRRIRIGGLGKYDGFTHIDVRSGAGLARWTGARTAKETG